MIIKKDFFNRYTPTVARDLLGCFLVRDYKGRIIRAMITETEAYRGEYDLACHASRGRTQRTEILYSRPGTAYVYLIYGMYYMLNVVTEAKDFPAAVLIRAVSIPGEKALNINGPGKLTKYLHIDKLLNGYDITKGNRLWLEANLHKKKLKTRKTPRVGIDYARHCKHWKWNFKI